MEHAMKLLQTCQIPTIAAARDRSPPGRRRQLLPTADIVGQIFGLALFRFA